MVLGDNNLLFFFLAPMKVGFRPVFIRNSFVDAFQIWVYFSAFPPQNQRNRRVTDVYTIPLKISNAILRVAPQN